VYKSFNGPLVEHQLVVYVNETPPRDLAATRIFPVELNRGNFVKIDTVGDHCNSVETDFLNEPMVVTYKQVQFLCDMGSSTYKVFVGVIGGTNSIEAIRPNGEQATYSIFYENLKFLPSPNQIDSIMSTFQVR
jgi:hypothetical protein